MFRQPGRLCLCDFVCLSQVDLGDLLLVLELEANVGWPPCSKNPKHSHLTGLLVHNSPTPESSIQQSIKGHGHHPLLRFTGHESRQNAVIKSPTTSLYLADSTGTSSGPQGSTGPVFRGTQWAPAQSQPRIQVLVPSLVQQGSLRDLKQAGQNAPSLADRCSHLKSVAWWRLPTGASWHTTQNPGPQHPSH